MARWNEVLCDVKHDWNYLLWRFGGAVCIVVLTVAFWCVLGWFLFG